MSDRWRTEPLSDLCSFLGRGAAPVYVDEGGILVFNQKCVRSGRLSFISARRSDSGAKHVRADRLLQSFDVLVNSTGVGTLGRVAQVLQLPEPATVDSHVTIVRADPSKVLPRFLGFALRELETEIETLAEGSTGQTELSRTRLGALLIQVPPERDQRAIVDILDALDRKLELNRKMFDVLGEIVRALFRSWFVDFDPVRAKAQGREAELPPSVAALFPDRLEVSEVGEIPAGWTVTDLGAHVTVAKGLSYKGAGLVESGMPLHNLNSVHEGGGYKYEGIKYYNGDFADRHVVHPGDVVVANTEQGHDRLLIGYAAIIPRTFGQAGIFSHHLYRVRPQSKSCVTPALLSHMLNSVTLHDIVSRYANGTTVNMLPVDGLRLPRFALAPAELIRIFDEFACLVHERQQGLVDEVQTLRAVVDALASKLVSGRLRAPEERSASALGEESLGRA